MPKSDQHSPTGDAVFRPLTSYLEILQVTIVLGAVEEEASLTLGTLDEAVGGEQLLHHARLSDARPRAVGIRSVPIVMEHARVKAHLWLWVEETTMRTGDT